jgi:zinc/manganese transport system substrate-binding protein
MFQPSGRRNGSQNPRRAAVRRLTFTILVALAMLAAACSDAGSGTMTTPPPAGDTTTTPAVEPVVHVVATTTILGDVVRSIVGDHGIVDVLMPIGADPHDFNPSSRQVALMQDADLIVANGLLLEEGVMDVLEALEGEGARVLWVAERLDPLPFGGNGRDHDDGHDHDNGHDHGEYDPHVWTDPIRMAAAALIISDELTAITSAVDWLTPAQAYADDLVAVDAEIASLVATLPPERRLLVTNHDALGYFADRYGFTVVGTVIPGGTTLSAPSPAALARLVDIIEELGIPAIFAENIDTTVLATALAAEVGHDVAVVELTTDSLGEPGTETGTLRGMLLGNARAIVDALR